MSTVQQIANSFVTEFFERLAKNPAELAELYGYNAFITINDFEHGTTEIFGAAVPGAVEQWAAIVAGSKLSVENVSAAAVHGGLNVFVSLSSNDTQQQQYFQINTSLEEYPSGFAGEGFFIRHQVISRIGAVPVETEEAPAPVPEPAAPAVEPTPAVSQKPKEAEKVATPTPAAEAKAAAPVEEAAPTPAAEAPAAPAAPKMKSWASLAGSPAAKQDGAHKPLVVVAHAGQKKEEVPAAAAKGAGAAAVNPKENFARKERKPAERVGDRLMFNIDFTVTDDEIKEALGPMTASLVSLRNNSAKGHVFMDFAEKVNALDAIKNVNPVIGSSRTKINVFRQRSRD